MWFGILNLVFNYCQSSTYRILSLRNRRLQISTLSTSTDLVKAFRSPKKRKRTTKWPTFRRKRSEIRQKAKQFRRSEIRRKTKGFRWRVDLVHLAATFWTRKAASSDLLRSTWWTRWNVTIPGPKNWRSNRWNVDSEWWQMKIWNRLGPRSWPGQSNCVFL
jgi:hypothetical protein